MATPKGPRADPLVCVVYTVGLSWSLQWRPSSARLPWSSLYLGDEDGTGGYYLGFKRGTLRRIQVRWFDSVRLCCFEGKELAMMSNKEQAFQRCLDSAAELEGGLRLSREEGGSAIRFSFLQIHSWLTFVRSGEAGFASLAVSPLVQMGLPASFPAYSTDRSGLCLTALPSNKAWSSALSLGP